MMDSCDRTSIQKCMKHLQVLIRKNSLSLDAEILREDQILSPLEKKGLLDNLSEQLLVPNHTVAVATSFSPFLLDLLERVCQRSSPKQFSLERHEQICAACSRLISFLPDAQKFIEKYLQTSPPVFERLLKIKSKSKKDASYRDIALTARRLVEHSPNTYADLWDWSPFLNLLESQDVETRWHAANTVACITKMGGGCHHKLFSSLFTKDEICCHQLRDSKNRDQQLLLAEDTSGVMNFDLDLESTQQKDVEHEPSVPDYHESVVSVCGVLLPRATAEDPAKTSLPKLVQVQTTKKNLRSLALAVSVGNGVLLEGPVGCGKTALVEHLAAQTGRTAPPSIIKVQLGDQTDSKALLGTYRCTDIPGEFVWQAGALTQAVTHGHWILLEDIDYAPMDVISVLLPLLESRSLCIPGHGNVIKAAPGFQLFATQRLLSSSGGLHRQHVSHGAMLDQLWTRVQVEPMCRDELHQVITTLYPKLTTVANRLLDIFCLLTAGHQMWLDTRPENESSMDSGDSSPKTASTKMALGSHDRRLVSTRDLIKWCERIERDFEINSSQSANMVFLEALDCFCAALTKPETRLAVAEQIGAKLNITREKARFYCSTYKPNIEEADSTISSGRATLQRKERDTLKMQAASQFAFTRPAAVLVERVACCIAQNEPVLLVGETGTGKTSTIQYLSSLVGQRLKVINMNQQSDSTDLLGGFKPVDLRHVVAPVREAFEGAFRSTFSVKQNTKFLGHIQKCFTQRQWRELVQLMIHSQQAALKRFEKVENKNGDGANKKDLGGQWRSIGERLHQLQLQIQHSENTLAFSFVEGTLVKALRNGDWILLDEINLATAETLECLSSLLESTEGSVVLMERGDTKPIVRHKDFRLFACMNPATDVGKKELPPGIRNRFTELFVDELEEVPDLKILTKSYLRLLSITEAQVEGIVQFYLSVRREAVQKLTDGTGHRPHYSLRTLCRALKLASTNRCDSVPRSLYESFCLSFLTQLDRASHPIVEKLVCKHVIGKSNLKSLLGQSIPPPAGGNKYMKLEGYWVAVGEKEEYKPKDYVITPSVKANLRDLARIVSAGRFPVLIQGETSVGKTSLVNYLAQLTGNHCVRVNNHEHTDLQEYVGFYAADETGKLVFKEGVLVDAMRKGHWIILDELNLAPSDVLEALNRLLDDNRELFIPETQEVVAAHPKFMLFATQNPPGQYGGRKVLSRAFRNRFVELHFDEIPSRELETILHDRCQIPVSYCRKMVATMLELQMRRKGSGVFAGKQGFITLRDLFRWAERYRHASQGDQAFYDWNQHIADEGYILLAGRVRREEEAETIRQVLEKHIKRVVNPQHLFTLSERTSPVTRHILEKVTSPNPPPGFSHIVWTYGMRRLAVLVGQALKFGEPVLLVGETGCGKTTICQLFAALADQKLHAVNCHLHTETSDFLGGLRPVRHHNDETDEESQKLFEWCDGPLILAMRDGAVFLIDEISLADDSVLERLNSVLEPERTLLLAEKGSGEESGDEIAVIKAQESFRVVSTMNPGGDFGKKELSPALRNRFTEIWCPQNRQRNDLVSIIEHNLCEGVQLCNQEDGSSGIGNAVMDFVEWFANNEVGRKCTISIRDILSWVNFINVCCDPSKRDPLTSPDDPSPLDPAVAYIHGACMVFVDGLGSGTTSNSLMSPAQARQTCMQWLSDQIMQLTDQEIDLSSLLVTSDMSDLSEVKGGQGGIVCDGMKFGIEPFYIERGPSPSSPAGYALDAPTTALNAQRILRALQLPRAVLLEGSPGVGKTSLVSALAKASGNGLVRINLSEQTDITDLFGADLPVEGGEGGQFAWRDGPLLQALKAGQWVVLDELNLASQSVLEGLNACLDHRAEVFVPELGRSFQIQKTRLFACQNPLKQGGGRKGLPKSFLNRFTQVYIEPFTAGDLLFIIHSMYPMIDRDTLTKMVEFSNRLYRKIMIECRWGQRGGPWEFNLRDLFRWCDLMVHDHGVKGQVNPGLHVGLVYGDRMRTADDKEKILKLYQVVFSKKGDKMRASAYRSSRHFHITHSHVQVGHSFLARCPAFDESSALSRVPLQLLHHDLEVLESLMKCVEMNWMSILVGPSSSGKTSLVHLLASLTGHRLQVLAMNSAMDTTELLGGFEQADLNRHWESLLGMIGDVSMATIRHLLTNEPSKMKPKAKRIMGILSALKQPSAGRHQDNLCPTEQKLNLLDQLLAELQKCTEMTQDATELAKVMEAANDLKNKCKLEDHSTPGGGGRFEWVDGLLVHALKNGDWLLIDNVNFCSPSVLDRLNALLEPGGVLTINERGVIHGEIPSITPHPQFRLFLSMDPRHGEISRAMRNRGVEIYMLGENEGGAYSSQDTWTLLHSLGLSSEETITSLMHIHQEMRSRLQGTDSARLPSLLLAASMVMQLVRNGLAMRRALWEACMEVYVNSQLLIANKQRARETLEQCLKGHTNTTADENDDIPMETEEHSLADACPIPSDGDDDDGDCIIKAYPLTDAELLNANPALMSIQRQGAVLQHLMGKKEEQISERTFSKELLVKAALLFVLERASQEDWKLCSDWLKSLGACPESMLNVGQLAEGVLHRLMNHSIAEKMEKEVKELCSEHEMKGLLINSPLDVHWNEQLLKLFNIHLQMAASDQEEAMDNDSADSMDRIRALATRLFVFLRRSLSESLLTHQTNPKPGSKKKKKPVTVLQLSQALQKGRLSSEALPHQSVTHVGAFFQAWDQFFSERLAADVPLEEDQAFKIVVACHWRDRLWRLCTQPITDCNRFSFGQLALHWDWFLKETVQIVKSVLTDSTSLPVELHTIMKCLHASLSHSDTPSTMMTLDLSQWEGLCSLLGQPLPFQTALVAETSQRITKLCHALDVIRQAGGKVFRRRRDADRCVAFLSSSQGLFTCRILMDCLMKAVVLQNQTEYASEAVGPIEYNLIQQGLLPRDPTLYPEEHDSTPDQKHGTVQDTHEMAVWLWPVKEHLAITTSQRVVSQMMAETFKLKDTLQSYDDEGQLKDKESLYEYTRLQVPFNPLLLCPLNTVLLHPHSKIGSVKGHAGVIAELAASHLFHMQSNTVAASMERWLSWKPNTEDDEEMQTFVSEDSSPVMGPANLHTPVQTRCMFHLLFNHHHHAQPPSTTPHAEKRQKDGVEQAKDRAKSVPLVSWEEHQSHLQEITEVLWRNSGWASSKDYDFMLSSVTYLVTSAAWLLRAFASLLPDEGDRTRWLIACSDLVTMATPTTNHIPTTSPTPCPESQSPFDNLRLILEYNSGQSQTDIEALPLVRDERGEALRVIDTVGGLVKNLLHDMEIPLTKWLGRDTAITLSDTFVKDLNSMGICWIRIGHLQSVLLAPQGPVDPAEHHAIKLRYIKEEISELEAELKVRGMSSKFLTGKSLLEFDHQDVHPRIHVMQERLALLREMEAELSKRKAFRPHPPQFDDLIKDIQVYMNTSGSSKTVDDLLHKQVDVFHKLQENSAMLRDEHRAWQASQEHFLNRIRTEYPSYRDLWFGMLTGVAGLSYGMQLLAHSVHCQHHRQHLQLTVSPRPVEQIATMEELVVCITGFSSVQSRFPTWLSLAESLTTENVHSLLQSVWAGWSVDQAKQEQLMHSILKLALHHTINHTSLHGQLMPATLDLLHGIMGSFVSHYHQAEEAARQREEEEASLYKYKSRSHGDGMTDEQLEEKELRESFPSFEKEFADITVEPSLDDHPNPDDDPTTSATDWNSTRQLDTATMQLLRDTHCQMFRGMVKIGWMRPGDRALNLDMDVRNVARLGYTTVVELAHEVLPYMAPCIDKHLIGAHLMRVHDLQVAIATEQSDEKSKPIRKTDSTSKPYDIYHDPNIQETIRCKPVLDGFMERINGLLTEWPEHPTLKQLTMLIERIQSFSVDSPLMKFVTGLELLLSKSQEWESNASKAVSIQTHLEEITQTIIRWRKLELNCWVAMLDNVTFKHAEGSLKWWFHVYRLIQTYLAKSGDGNLVEKPSNGTVDENHAEKPSSGTEDESPDKAGEDDGEGEDETTVSGIVGILQKLIEGANLGEFAARLEMLLAFHSQIIASMQSTKEISELSCILWNMYCYYRQFLPAVTMEIENKRKPIEKELKDFVKIAKWNDISFWAMKQAVEKTHKTLIKFRKKYEVTLQGPAKAVFVDDKIEACKQKDETKIEDIVWKDEWRMVFGDERYQEYFTKSPAPSETAPQDTGLVARIPVLFERMRKHCSSLVTKRKYSVMSETLDDFVGEIVTTVKELQALDVTKDAEPDKQKAEIRHIHQRKRKALSELFKYLTSIGLSYKKGLIRLNQTDKNQPENFLSLPPVDLQATFTSCDKSPDQWPVTTSYIPETWVGCHEYFFRCQARRAALRDAVANPSKELGVGNIERVKGFTEHLSDLTTDQRREIATMATSISKLRNVLNEMGHLHKSSSSDRPVQTCHLPPQEESAVWITRSKSTVDQSLQAVLQFTAILDCCPELDEVDGESKTKVMSPVPAESLTKADRSHKGDPVWLDIKTNIKVCQDSLEELKAVLDPCAHHIEQAKMKEAVTLIPWDSIRILRQCHSSFTQVAERLAQAVGAFTLPETSEQIQLVHSLVYSRQCITSWSAEFETWNQSLGEERQHVSDLIVDTTSSIVLSNARHKMEETVKCILLGVQSLVKAEHITMSEEGSEVKEEKAEQKDDVEESEFDLEGLLVKKIVSGLSHDQRLLEVNKVVTCGADLLTALYHLREQCRSAEDEQIFNRCCSMAASLIPMMQQYLGLACVFLHHMVAAHRATTKLQSVLLSIFTDLASKGFCLPAEYSDEMAGEGATEFEDIEGGGIGDGEGTKDVSDQIENEDQVQDTKMPGEKEKEEEDFSEQPDLKDEEHGIEMSEDFEGKLHDQEPTEGGQDKDEKEDDGEEELDKQMGDVDGPDTDKLDERMWGDEEEEEEEDGEKKNKEQDQEFGDGMDEEESRMVAKEENQGDAEGDDKDQNKEKQDNPEEPPDPNNLEPKDESEFNDDEIDPRQANDPPAAPVPDNMDLPDDLDMDKDEKMEEGEDNQEEANPLDIEEERLDEAPKEGEDDQGDDGEGKDEEKMETGENDGEEEGANQDEPVAMETNEEPQEEQDGIEEGRGEDKKGFEDKEEGDENEENEDETADKDEGIDYAPDQSHDTDQPPIGAEAMARSKASKDMVQAPEDEDETKEQEQKKEEAGKSGEDPEEDKHKSGTAESHQDQKGHEGSATSEVKAQEQSAREESKQSNKPSQSDSKRSLGSTQERYNKRLKTVDPNEERERRDGGKEKEEEAEKSDLYEHLADSEARHDAQMMDAATEDQIKEKESVPTAGEEGDEELEDGDEEKMKVEEEKKEEDPAVSNELPSQTFIATSDSSKLEAQQTDSTTETKEEEHTPEDEDAGEEDDTMETEAGGEKLTESTIHTVMEHLGQGGGATSMVMEPEEVEKLRREMEEQLALMSRHGDREDEEAEKMWQSCESVTSSLARDLCEQLRLVLEPTQASKLRGDFRTGKRLNMRKVIPYIASGFRKDKIWLRRTKPSKRQYQIMLAVDDSSSMADNRSKRLAFESLAVISNALTWLEAGQLAVCSFGESVKLLHPFHEQFSDQSGSSILRQFTFAQKKTKIAQLLKYASASMLTARSMRPPGGASAGHPETSQLLVIVSDGRGLFLEGMETVKNAVRAARDANIFLMFVVIDNPENKDSILDIRVPIFKQAGAMPEIQSYMEHFPFPFYIILRNINALPETLSDALRQWFELVTAADKS